MSRSNTLQEPVEGKKSRFLFGFGKPKPSQSCDNVMSYRPSVAACLEHTSEQEEAKPAAPEHHGSRQNSLASVVETNLTATPGLATTQAGDHLRL